MTGPIVALAGGVGGAKLALGLATTLPTEMLAIVVNTGDDEVFHGLHVSPDLDTVMYALAGLTNPRTEWGIANDSFAALSMLERYGAPTWFNLGDMDLATHVRRTELLKRGWPISRVTRELCQSLGVRHPIVPMTDATVRTIVETDEGDLSFQVYFVERQCQPVAKGIRFENAETAAMADGFIAALDAASGICFCPSNPFLSIAPILAMSGARERIASFPGTRVVVSPIVGGKALRGPAAKLLAELGHEVSCVGVARYYQGLCDVFVIDEVDRGYADAIRDLGMTVEVTSTVMDTDEDKATLAAHICSLMA